VSRSERTDRKSVPGAGAAAAEPAYDAIVERLEKVVGELEAGTLTLEQSIEKFAEGVQLARDAARKLEEAERRVEVLLRAEDGTPEARPLGGEEGER
jgi:exodeoxyribonuclease VII small subunit